MKEVTLMHEVRKHCRWCGIRYMACYPSGHDGFCKPSHKQAHYRAYKKYVTAKTGQQMDQKTRKKGR